MCHRTSQFGMCSEFQIIAFMVLAIIAASLALVMFILSVIGAHVGVPRYEHFLGGTVS